jgi:hypothetical protein
MKQAEIQGILAFFVVFLLELHTEIECDDCRENRQKLFP